MVSIYAVKSYSRIYMDSSVGIVMYDNDKIINAKQFQVFNTPEMEVDVMMLDEVSKMVKDVEIFNLFMKTKLPVEIDKYVIKFSKNYTESQSTLYNAYISIKDKMVWFRNKPTSSTDRARISVASKLCEFTKNGMVGEKAVEYFLNNYISKDVKKMISDMEFEKDSEEVEEKERINRINKMKRSGFIIVVSREKNNDWIPVFSTYDIVLAETFIDDMSEFFTRNRNAKDIYAMIMKNSGLPKSKSRFVPRKHLDYFGISQEKWTMICINTFNGESDKFRYFKIPVK